MYIYTIIIKRNCRESGQSVTDIISLKTNFNVLTGESANYKMGFVPGERCGRKGVVLVSMLGCEGFSGFMSSMLLMPYFIIFVWSWPKSPASRPVDDFICIFSVCIGLLFTLRDLFYIYIYF